MDRKGKENEKTTLRLRWSEVERQYTRPLTAREIAEAFPEEIREIVPRYLRLAERALKAMEELLAPELVRVPKQHRPAAWLLLRTAWGVDELEAKVEAYRRLLNLVEQRDRKERCINVRELKQCVNVLEVCRNLGLELKPSGRYFRARCPFPDHEDRCPSFVVNPETGYFCCFGCNRRGDVISLLRELRGLSFSEAIKELRRWA